MLEHEGDFALFIASGPPPGVPEALHSAIFQPFGALVLRAYNVPAPAFSLTAAHAYFEKNGGGIEAAMTADGGLELRCRFELGRSVL